MKRSWKAAIFLLPALLMKNAFAEEALKSVPPAPKQTSSGAPADMKNKLYALRGRSVQVNIWLSQGFLGEGGEGLLVSRGTLGQSITAAMKEENADREAMFKSAAAKLGTTVMQQKKLYAKKRAAEAPVGSPIQQTDGSWKLKTS